MEDCCELSISELIGLDDDEPICTDCVDRLYDYNENLMLDAYIEDWKGVNND